MPNRIRQILKLAGIAVASALLIAPAAAQYRLNVNGDRLVNAQNEPQNWLLMNGDYAASFVTDGADALNAVAACDRLHA